MMDWGIKESDYREEIQATAILAKAVQDADGGFYRMETDKQRTGTSGNDPMFYGYNGVGNSSSCERIFVNEGLSKFGVSWYQFRNSYDEGMAAAMDSLLGIKYVISENDLAKEKGYELKINDMMGKSLYENPYVLPIAILSESDFSDLSLEGWEDVFEIQNEVWNGLTGEDEKLFTKAVDVTYSFRNSADPMTLTDKEISSLIENKDYEDEEVLDQDASAHFEFTFMAEQDGPIYFYNAGIVNEEEGTLEDALQYVGYYQKGDEVTGGFYVAGEMNQVSFEEYCKNFQIYYTDMDVLQKYSTFLQQKDSSIEKVSDTLLMGRVTVDEGMKTILLTIPYDKGWQLVVDGKEKALLPTLGLFMSFTLPEGEHTYELRFSPIGYRFGCLISLLCLLLCLYMVWKKRHPNHREDQAVSIESLQVNADSKKKILAFFFSGLLCGIAFLVIHGYGILDVTYDDWLLAYPEGSDNVQHYMGWVAYRDSAWHFPVGLIDNIVYPNQISVIYTDSIPIVAFFFKLISPILPETFQYFGWFGLLCAFLLGGFAGIFVCHFTGRMLYSVLCSLFFGLSYVFLFRMYYHTGLAAQWMIVAALYVWLCVDHKNVAKEIGIWSGLGVLAVLTEAYFVPMVWGIMLCALLTDVLKSHDKGNVWGALLKVTVAASATIGVGYLFGLFYGDISSAAAGLNLYSFNLNGFFNSFGMSVILPQLTSGAYQYEGFAYMGLGMIVLFLLSLGQMGYGVIKGGFRLPMPYKISIGIFVVGFVLFAASPWIRIGCFIIDVPVPQPVSEVWSTFRSTGRMIWPVYYFIFLFSCVVIGRLGKGRWLPIACVALCLCVQILDGSSYLSERHNKFANRVEYVNPLEDAAWEEIAANYDHII